ncbi:TetR/AcrR family transcriptional regulator, partial [Mycolicibacterium elephantis]
MSVSSAESSNGKSRREELLAVATKLFAARGYHGTRMD